MNVIDLANRLIGCFGIIGGSMAAATGAAISLQRTGGIAVVFFGDGTTNHGDFFECLNLAKVRSLPVVYVCENNRYGEFTPFEDVTAGTIVDRPPGCEELDQLDAAVAEQAEAIQAAALAAPFPDPAELAQASAYKEASE